MQTHDVMRKTKTVDHRLLAVPIAADTVIYKGAIAAVSTRDGLARPATDAENLIALGLVTRGYDNRGGPAGTYSQPMTRFIEVDTAAIASYRVAAGDVPIPGTAAVIQDDDTVTVANSWDVSCGTFFEPDPARADHWFVDHSRR